ncbi:hypothetical protein [uncultured Nostoc sp.]|uniref:hypothetical protein n=1 Tax=uncultured Nostoc sp. TaxID=340711 RepID=UPI0035CA3353
MTLVSERKIEIEENLHKKQNFQITRTREVLRGEVEVFKGVLATFPHLYILQNNIHKRLDNSLIQQRWQEQILMAVM